MRAAPQSARAPLAFAHAIERYDLAPGRGLGHFLRYLLGNAEEPLTSIHPRPDILGMDAGRHPQHDEVVDQIGAFAHHRVGVAMHGVDDDLDRFLGKLLGHLAAAGAQQASRARDRRISGPRCKDGLIEAVERISHAGATITPSVQECVNEYGGARAPTQNAAGAALRATPANATQPRYSNATGRDAYRGCWCAPP